MDDSTTNDQPSGSIGNDMIDEPVKQNGHEEEDAAKEIRVNEETKRKESIRKKKEEMHTIWKNLALHPGLSIPRQKRNLIHSGLVTKVGQKKIKRRMLLLVSDILLYTKPLESTLLSPKPNPTRYYCKHILPLKDLKVHAIDDFDNEFIILSGGRSFPFRVRNSTTRDVWICAIRKTVNEFNNKTRTNPDVMSVEYPRIGQLAPVLVPKSEVSKCQGCEKDFSITVQKHHCYACGKVFCDACSNCRAPLKYDNFSKNVRVCDKCCQVLVEDVENGDIEYPNSEWIQCGKTPEDQSKKKMKRGLDEQKETKNSPVKLIAKRARTDI